MTSKDLRQQNQSKGLTADKVLYLLNMENGRVFPWTPLLAVRPNFIDCTEEGVPIDPSQVPGDHPWIRKQTEGLRDRMAGAGANDNTLQDMGRQLTEDASRKFKSIEYARAKSLRLEGSKSAASTGASVRIANKLDRRVHDAKAEIREMTINALMSHGMTRLEAYRKAL